MFRLSEIVKAVGGQLISGNSRLRISGVSIDSRKLSSGELFIAIKGDRFDGHNFIQDAVRKGARAIIGSFDSPQSKVNKKIPYIRVADTRCALADLARFHRQRFNIPIIAVTGSNGKTTVKDMIAWILSSRLGVLNNQGTQNNEIGVPLTLLRLDISHDVAVLELGTNHFGEIANLVNIAQPNFGIITNIGPSHLEYLRDVAGVYKEKISLLKNLRSPKIAILNADDPWLRKLKNNNRVFMITYGIKNICDFYATEIKLTKSKTIEFLVNPSLSHLEPILLRRGCGIDSKRIFRNSNRRSRIQLTTISYANIYNALAAIAVARLFGWNYELISKRLARFIFPKGRLSLTKLKGISFVDDTYNANPTSLSEALGVLSKFRVRGRRILVMGDMLELGESSDKLHRQAGIQIARICDVFISVGKLTQLSAIQAVRLGLSKDRVFTCEDSLQARKLLFKTIKPNCRDLILVKGSRLMKMEEVLKE